MDILGILGSLPALLANPAGVISMIVLAIVAIMGGPHILNFITTYVSDAVLYIDNKVIDLIPIPPVKAYFQNQLINMLKTSVTRYQALIKKISD